MKHLEQNDQHLLAEVRSIADRMSVLEGPTGRRSWLDKEKARIVLESFAPGARVDDVARRHRLTPQHLSTWR
ncbi:MAG: transposase, partial [Pseudomonadota bacterium]